MWCLRYGVIVCVCVCVLFIGCVLGGGGCPGTCPRDHKVGSAYVDTLVHSEDIGRATALLIVLVGVRNRRGVGGAVGLG